MMEFTGKVAVVTGGASGIGQATAREFAQRKAKVAIVDRDAELGQQTAEELGRGGAEVKFFQGDVSKRNQVQKLVRDIVAKWGGIDILVNNAGIQRYGSALSTSEELWDEVIAVNLKSAYLMSQSTIPEMVKRGGGAIVMSASVQSFSAIINSTAYVVSKHGLLGLTRAMALDHAKQNIRVNCVCPGAIDTPMLRWAASLSESPETVLEACNRMHALGRMGKPEEVARVIAFLASDLASFVTGEAVMVDGGMLIAAGGMAFQESGTGASKK